MDTGRMHPGQRETFRQYSLQKQREYESAHRRRLLCPQCGAEGEQLEYQAERSYDQQHYEDEYQCLACGHTFLTTED